MRQLKSLLAEIGVGQRAAARATGLPVTTINRLCNGQPTPRHWKQYREKLAAWLQERGVAEERVKAALDEAAGGTVPLQMGPETSTEATDTEQGDEEMIMRKQGALHAREEALQAAAGPLRRPAEPRGRVSFA